MSLFLYDFVRRVAHKIGFHALRRTVESTYSFSEQKWCKLIHNTYIIQIFVNSPGCKQENES